MSLVHLASRMAGWLSWLGKNFNIGCYMQTFRPIFFIPAMLIGTIDFYHFIPLPLTLTLPGFTRSAQSKTSWLHFLTHIFLTDQDEISYGVEAIDVEHSVLVFIEIFRNKGIKCCFTDFVKKNPKNKHAFESIWFKFGMVIGTIVLYILILV